MELEKLNMYQRLRDFEVPSVFLDEIFKNDKDLDTLSDAWKALKSSGLSDDDTAQKIASIIFDLDLFKDPEIIETLESIKNLDDLSKN
ncbi:MAG: hypothetical protein QF453_00035 [Candidatus Marinimicrobia bacterium]|jgi:hypothetical protein|nr:hypothetical protein [Candidatus Neomarinimicrobiota bacterium]|tara:strand:+ start:87 stop:350 length:264 start_codon:yes stop_codon:yes gene_type:complete